MSPRCSPTRTYLDSKSFLKIQKKIMNKMMGKIQVQQMEKTSIYLMGMDFIHFIREKEIDREKQDMSVKNGKSLSSTCSACVWQCRGKPLDARSKPSIGCTSNFGCLAITWLRYIRIVGENSVDAH